eukprot:711788_1
MANQKCVDYEQEIAKLKTEQEAMKHCKQRMKHWSNIDRIRDIACKAHMMRKEYHAFQRCAPMEHWTICCAFNFIIKTCAEYGNKSNGFMFGGDDMLRIMNKISEV